MIPFDKESARVTSGLRIGTPAVTTLGMDEEDMVKIAEIMEDTLVSNRYSIKINRDRVHEISSKYILNKE